jgi:hypothetical protein
VEEFREKRQEGVASGRGETEKRIPVALRNSSFEEEFSVVEGDVRCA